MEKKKKEPMSYDEVFLYVSDKKYSCSDDSRKRAIRSKAAGFITADGVLITLEKNSIEPRRWIRDLETRMQILKSCHHGLEGGHFGRDKTRSKISARYYWQGLGEDVEKWVSQPIILIVFLSKMSLLWHTSIKKSTRVTHDCTCVEMSYMYTFNFILKVCNDKQHEHIQESRECISDCFIIINEFATKFLSIRRRTCHAVMFVKNCRVVSVHENSWVWYTSTGFCGRDFAIKTKLLFMILTL